MWYWGETYLFLLFNLGVFHWGQTDQTNEKNETNKINQIDALNAPNVLGEKVMHAPHESPPLFDNGGAYLPAVIVADLSAFIFADQPDRRDRPNRRDRLNRPNQPNQPNRPNRRDRLNRPNQPNRPNRPNRPKMLPFSLSTFSRFLFEIYPPSFWRTNQTNQMKVLALWRIRCYVSPK